MNGTEHHCDTCTCAPPVPDLNAALQAASTLDVRGAYSVRIDLDGHITLQGDAPNMADLIGDIADTRHVLTIGPVGSEGRHVTIHRHYDGPNSTTWGHLIIAGCWEGTADQLDHRIHTKKKHGWDEAGIDHWRTDYEGVIALARARTAEWAAVPLADEDHERWEQVTA